MPHPSHDSPLPTLPQEIAKLTAADFAALVGQPMEAMGAGDATVDLTLLEVAEHSKFALPNQDRVPFSLFLVGDAAGPCLDGGTYILRHPQAGSLPPLYISRVAPRPGSADKAWYQVVFN